MSLRFCPQKRPLIGQTISSLPIRDLLFFVGKSLELESDRISEKTDFIYIPMSKLNKHLEKECKL